MHPSQFEHLVILTGAGISAESGVPTFRGEGGLWEDHRAEDLATPLAFRNDPALVWRFYHFRRATVSKLTLTTAHHLLVQIERQMKNFTLITQNVDGLQSIVGSQKVIELHGSLWRMRCTRCHTVWEDYSVHPAATIPMITRSVGALLIEINPESTPLSPHANQVIHEAATTGLAQW